MQRPQSPPRLLPLPPTRGSTATPVPLPLARAAGAHYSLERVDVAAAGRVGRRRLREQPHERKDHVAGADLLVLVQQPEAVQLQRVPRQHVARPVHGQLLLELLRVHVAHALCVRACMRARVRQTVYVGVGVCGEMIPPIHEERAACRGLGRRLQRHIAERMLLGW